MSILKQIAHKAKVVVYEIFNKKPAYLIKPNGIKVKYWNLAKTEKLPFDRETFEDTQLFIGNWANPWHVDIDSIKEEYPDFTEENITNVNDVFAKNHVYPSQRWKLLANQKVLEDMFVGGGIDYDRVMRLLYAVLAGVGFLLLLILSGGTPV